MSTTAAPETAPRNRLLAALPAEDLARLRPKLKLVELELRQNLATPEQRIEHAYFFEAGWASVLAPLDDGDSAEVGLAGMEGMVGWPLSLGDDTAELEVMVQCAGTAWRLTAADFREALEASTALRGVMLRFVLAQHTQVAWTAACNGRHSIEQRLARWLLMAHDRSEGDTFPITHEFLSMMLGVRRAGVTVAAGVLQRAGMIRYGGGRMTITDRPGLEASSCECYGSARRTQERQFPPVGERYRR
ncbi:MAG: cAMP-binding proteins - catabolite gene activator and regulatory subunit of cAMP-dependent protein kinases [uncultured Craurococcus sp.]|uniref:cAMP-binding proteins - catabolite gene activator and regulatory subunit of cAMP-dependent protein kinases n=1 Tax=uncultured Craurococcus sp. TaxID=1135998 RepID=A0A6J4I203_9PROT|nr:MAG: cAMP-binding proteins - catabolite gene activator and regulatory subunit of cAMP-dependent protein kinases [uncultured Craurococcus sp.]